MMTHNENIFGFELKKRNKFRESEEQELCSTQELALERDRDRDRDRNRENRRVVVWVRT